MTIEDVAVIGAGPAGLTAAVQLARFGIGVAVFEAQAVGGLVHNANLIENYPGFPRGIRGSALAGLLAEQAERWAVPIRLTEVVKLEYVADNSVFELHTADQLCVAKSVIVASGTEPIEFTDIEVPPAVQDRCFYEVYPIQDVVGKKIAIVGAGDAAFDYALNLGRRNEVAILNRGSRVRALGLLRDRCQRYAGITYMPETSLSRIEADDGGEMVVHCEEAGGGRCLQVDLLVFAVGRRARVGFLAENLRNKGIQNQTENLYFCGDVRNAAMRQTAMAVGDGMKAAMSIYLRDRG